jgi:uncharacterized protein YrrD
MTVWIEASARELQVTCSAVTMLQSANDLHKFTLHAKDGNIGAVADLYFDDARWIVRYLVVDTAHWLPGRRVLISPASVEGVDWPARKILVSLTRDQVRNSPDTATDKPVSRQQEERLMAYYGWPAYWPEVPFGMEPMAVPPVLQGRAQLSVPDGVQGNSNLRSAREVKGYQLEARDGAVGRVSDFVFDDATWQIAFMVVDTGGWLHKRHVILKPDWIESISWEERHVSVRLTRETIRASPEFVPVYPLPAEYIEQLTRHYQGDG